MANKYKHLNFPQAEFDFHDLGPLTGRQILTLADEFIDKCLEKDFSVISFIAGQGKHSAKGPVIKPLLEDFLKNHPEVISFSEGKFAQGGQGVLIVRLK